MATETVSTTNGQKVESWLKYFDDHYKDNVKKWTYVADHLHGRVLDPDRIDEYLVKRKQGETKEAFEERKAIADYTAHFLSGIMSLAGMLWAVDEQGNRRWGGDNGEGLGDVTKEGSAAFNLSRNADGEGTNWKTVVAGATVDVIAYLELWAVVDGYKFDGDGKAVGGPTLKLFPPQAVPRPIRRGGRLRSVKIITETDPVDDQKQKPGKIEEYYIYRPEGFEIWRHDKDGKPQIHQDLTPYNSKHPKWKFVDRDGNDTVPVFRVRLPLRAPLGYLMARKANAIFNHENTNDFLLFVACFPKFLADVIRDGGEFDEKQYKELLNAFEKGQNLLPGAGSKFDSPPMEPAKIKSEIVKQKVTDFYATFFQSYGDAAKEKTATEIAQDFRSGEEAFLVLLADTMDEFENNAFWFFEQIENPLKSAEWGHASINRPEKFAPKDMDAITERYISRYFPNGRVPTIPELAAQVAKDIHEHDGFEVDDENLPKLAEAVRRAMARDEQATAVAADFDL